MKKSLLFVAALAASLSVSAQEYAQVDAASAGITETLSAENIAGGTVLAATDHVTMSNAFPTQMKAVTVNGPKNAAGDGTFKIIKVNGTQLFADDMGVQGNDNPKDADGGTPSTTLVAPASGAVFQFDVTSDGTLYVFAKMSSNKSYTVFEGDACLGYDFVQLAEAPLSEYIIYTLTGDAEYNYLDKADYPNGIMWPEQIVGGCTDPATWPKVGKNGVGYVKFNVYAEAGKYFFNANGSKASVVGFYFVPTLNDTSANITIETDGGEVKDLTAGISKATIETAGIDANAPMFNLAGQRVNKEFKGVVLQNGKKFINK